MALVMEGVARLEALRLRDALRDAGVPALLDPDSGMDLGRPTNVLVPGSQAEFARRVVADAQAGAEWVPDDCPPGSWHASRSTSTRSEASSTSSHAPSSRGQGATRGAASVTES